MKHLQEMHPLSSGHTVRAANLYVVSEFLMFARCTFAFEVDSS